MDRVGVCVVGLGNQGLAHLQALREVHLAEVVAVADADFDRARKVASELGVRGCYGSCAEAVEDPDVDAVIVATPDFAHTGPVLEALRAGKHVLVEKPMATNYHDAKAMADEAARRGLLLMVDFENRFNPPFAYIKRALEDGVLGEPIHAYLRLSDTLHVPRRMLGWASRTTVAHFLMSHTADLACWYFGGRVERVYARAVTRLLRDLGTPDSFHAILEFEGGGVAVLESSWVLPEASPSIFDFKVELVCSRGLAEVDTQRESLTITTGRVEYPHMAKIYSVHGRTVGFLREADRHFVECVLGTAKPLIRWEDGVYNVRVIEAILESAGRGTPVTL